MTNAFRIILVSACLILSLSALNIRAEAKPLDLTNTVWEGTDDQFSFSLTFVQGNTRDNHLVASFKRLGSEAMELRGQFSADVPDSRIRLAGIRNGEPLTLDLRLKMGDSDDKPVFYGDISTRSATYNISARCDNQCPGAESGRDGEPNGQMTRQNVRAALIGEWEDTSEEIGFKEYWSIKFVGGQWQIAGRFEKADTVVGRFHGEEIVLDSKKGGLSFLQVFDLKPDPSWIDSNDIEVESLGDRLKIRVRKVEAILNRTPNPRD